MYSAKAYEGLSATKILINAEADVNAKDNYGNTVLMYNCRDLSRGIYDVLSPNVVKSLIRAGANINEVNKDGNTALLYAIYTYNISVE